MSSVGGDAVEAKASRTQKMGLLGAASYIIGNIVGSGIFITPTSILNQVNSVGMSLVVWLASALIALLGSFCYVELGTSIRKSGADFAYLCYVKWYPIAFAFMCCGCIVIYPATLAVQADTFSEYVFKGFNITMESETDTYFAKKLAGFSLIWFLLFLNFFSLKTIVSRFNIVASICKILATGIVIGTGLYYLIFKQKTENLQDLFGPTTFQIGTFVTALFSGLFSYDGWDILNFGAEEIENPKRTMPLALIVGLSFIGILYLLVNFSYFIVLSIPELQASTAVAQTFAAATLGSFQYAIPFFVALLLVGSLNSTMFSASRYLQAAAKQGHLPAFISAINPASDSPRAALFIHIIIAMAISFAGDLDALINYVSFCQWIQRGCTMAALMYIRFTHKPVHPEAIKTFILLPMVFCLVCCVLVIVTMINSFSVSAVGLGILLVSFIFFFLFIFEADTEEMPSFRERSGFNKFLYSLRSVLLVVCFRSYAWFRNAMAATNNWTTKVTQIIFNVMPELVDEDDSEEWDYGGEKPVVIRSPAASKVFPGNSRCQSEAGSNANLPFATKEAWSPSSPQLGSSAHRRRSTTISESEHF